MDALLELTDSDLEPEFRPQEEVFVTQRVGSTELAERLLGFRAGTTTARACRPWSSGGVRTRRARSASVPRAHPGEAAARALRVPIARPSFGDEERKAIQQPLESGWVVQGPNVELFEERFRSHVGAEHAVATTSCTTALHLGVAILGLRPGDEVIVPAFTWVSTANVVEYMGATPVFCDVDLGTYNVDPRRWSERCHASGRSGSCRCTCSGSAPTWRPSTRSRRGTGSGCVEDAACAFGRSSRAATRARSATSAPSAFTRASRSQPARAGCSPPAALSRAELARISSRPRRRPHRPRHATSSRGRSCSPTTTASASTTG